MRAKFVPTLLLAVLPLAAAACGGDDEGYVKDLDTDTTAVSQSNADCRNVAGHPINVDPGPSGAEHRVSFVACSAEDGSSLHLENGSSHVLRIRPDDLYDRTQMALVKRHREPPGIDAAHSTTGAGMDAMRETFVLPMGQSMTAKSDSTVSVRVEGDFDLTVAANVARYFAAWAASKLPVRGEQLARPARRCAASVRGSVDEAGYVEDALRRAIDTPVCQTMVDDVARERGLDPAAERPRARAQIFRIARPALRERLLARTTTVLAER